MTIILRKVWGDLTHNKARTLLAVLSIGVGILALGLAFGALEEMRAFMEQDRPVSKPAHLVFRGAPMGLETFQQDLIDTALRRPGVAAAEGETSVAFRWKLDGETRWRFAHSPVCGRHGQPLMSACEKHWRMSEPRRDRVATRC